MKSFCCVLLGVAVGCSGALAQQAADTVPTVLVGAGAGGVVLVTEASVEAVHQATLAAQVQGRVLAVHVDAGERVRRGQVLLQIDPAEAAAAEAAAEAGVAAARTEKVNARGDYERARGLVERKFISPAALEAARARFEGAEARLRAAEAARDRARTLRGYATVVSPLDGRVAARHIEPGETAQPGRALITVYDPRAMRAVADVAPQRLAELGGVPARAVVELGSVAAAVEATDITVLPAADARTHTVRVRVSLPAGGAEIAPGSFARVRFHPAAGAGVPVMHVPAATILRRGELTAVYVAAGEGRFTLRQVRLGRMLDGGAQVEVLAGLKGDESVALDPVRAGLVGRTPAPAAR